jgi:para-aminobenzoate synthetase / 4-amino-4-deoxychorismate lyase
MTQAPDDKIRAWIELPASGSDPARRLVFGPPRSEWRAETLADVRPALARVAEIQAAGRCVAGFISYEAGPAFDAALRTPPKGNLPYAWFAAFEGTLNSPPLAPPSELGGRPNASTSPLSFRTSEAEYLRCVARALEHIRAGNIYQVNYTVRAELALRHAPLTLFRDRLAAVPMPHAAYLDGGDFAVVSLSPELFLRRRGSVLESRPMKGTAAREPDWRGDEAARRRLAASPKERAENTMIVDLVRNDLGRVCRAGSVTVPEWCVVHRFPTVHQMTSLVRGELREGVTLWEMLAATFPPGSVTGAPKVRAMEIIRDLEPEPRGVYCGTVGVFLPGGDFELNVAIRTVEIRRSQIPNPKSEPPSVPSSEWGDADEDSRVPPPAPPLKRRGEADSASLGLGSGIVADADPAAEWRETVLKGRFLSVAALPDFSLIETLAWTPAEGFRNLHGHLRRLRRSAEYFGWNLKLEDVVAELRKIAPPSPPVNGGELRVRILLNWGDVEVQTVPLEAWPGRFASLHIYDTEPVDPRDVLLYHKTTARAVYERALAAAHAAGADDAVLVNARGEVTETTRANLFVRLDGQWLTPALGCGLLPGIYRECWLADGRGREAAISVDDLRRVEGIVMANSARGAVEGKIVG